MMETVELIDLAEEHLEIVRNWRNSPEVSRYMYTDYVISEEQQKSWFQKVKNQDMSKYWIIKYGSKFLGVASLSGIDRTLQSCYWAFYLGDSSVRGVGVGAKVEFLVMEYVFEVLKLNKLRCEVFVFNENVIKMHEKFGFRREAYYREHCPKNGTFEDVVGLAILKTEWDFIKPQLSKKN